MRLQILAETIAVLTPPAHRKRLQQKAAHNLERWRSQCQAPSKSLRVQVLNEDWGEVAGQLTRQHGECIAVLNMASAEHPGGGYLEGCSAQEENLFRRSDCHFHLCASDYAADGETYCSAMRDLINGRNGRVYLDTTHPRICVRGREMSDRFDLGYEWLPDDAIFPFYELRAAAQVCTKPEDFDAADARRRIAAQLDTLQAQSIRHAVLGASGCGAYHNPPEAIASIYCEELNKRRPHFQHIAFALISRDHEQSTYHAFAEAFK